MIHRGEKTDEGRSEGWGGKWRCGVDVSVAPNRTGQDRTGSKVWVHTVRIYDALNVKCCLIQSDIFSEAAKTRFLLAGAFHTYPENPTAAFTMHLCPVYNVQAAFNDKLRPFLVSLRDVSKLRPSPQPPLCALSGFKQANFSLR